MKLTSLSFSDQESIPDRYALGKIDAQSDEVALGDNYNPQFSWDEVPPGTQSFALICHDPDVPTQADGVSETLSANTPRTDFFHWVLVDLPADLREIDEGAFSSGFTPRGKGGPLAPLGARQGINDYTTWFAADRDMNGDYFGYDGPCPPQNDVMAHRYIFTLYALDVPTLHLPGTFKGGDALRALQGHVLGQACITGFYTLNPALAPKQIGATSAS